MIRKLLEQKLNNAAKTENLPQSFSVSFSGIPAMCDFQSNSCFVLAKQLHANPLDIAQKIVANLQNDEDFIFEAVRPAFINIKLTDKGINKLAQDIKLDKVGRIGDGKRIYLDYGGPNCGKAMHIGHMRSFNIGEAFKRLYKKLGYDVISDIFLGDWGMPMGLIMAMLEKEGTLDDYIAGKLPLTLDVMNVAYPKASKLKSEDEKFKARAEEITLLFQHKTQPYFDFWKRLRNTSVSAIKQVCQMLNISFDLWNGESTANEYIPEVLKIFREKNLVRQSQGALVVDVAQEGEQIPIPKKSPDEVQRYENPMPPLILQKSNGGDMYATSDVATIYLRNKLYHPDAIHYFSDARQNQHFTQVFRACKMAGISPENQQLWHTGFGTVNGKDGKALKTRDGNNMQLLDLMNMLYSKAEEKLIANGTEYDENLKRQIGNAALKFVDLSSNVEKDYNFDIDRVLAFEGKTGPYIQYTACRIKSILNKAGEFEENFNLLPEHRKVILALNKLQSSYALSFEEKSLNSICTSLYEAASEFASFYNTCHVLSEPDLQKRSAHLTLLKLTLDALTRGADILGIEIPQKM